MRETEGDRIDIVGLAVPTIIGIFDWERKVRQKVLLDLTLWTDVRRAARTDRIEDALDYKEVSKRLQTFVGSSRFFLLERLAEEVAAILLGEFGARQVRVRVEKPGALRGAKTVAVTITRSHAEPDPGWRRNRGESTTSRPFRTPRAPRRRS
jgi:dihydroneopterin aldolase